MKKILFISYDGMTDPLGQSQVIPYLQGISKNGYKIFILSCEKKEVFEKNKPAIELLLKGYTIQWVPLKYTKKPPVLSTLWDVIQLKKAAGKIHRKHSIDMVHTRPGVPALVGLWMKQTTGVKFLHDIREFFADSRVDGGIWNLKNPVFRVIYNYFKKKEARQIQSCDGIVCLTRAGEKIISQSKEFRKNTPLEVIACSADMNLFDPAKITSADKLKLQNELDIKNGDLIITYLGSVGGWYLTKEMLLFCKQLSERLPLAKFLFITPHLHAVIEKEALKYGLSADKLIIKKGNRAEIPALLSLSTYSLFFIKPCYSKLSSSPTKHGEIMAMGIPVITNSGVGDVKEIVDESNSGFVVDNFNREEYDKIIDRILDADKFDSNEIRKSAGEFYSLDKAIEKYTNVYNQILN